MASGAQQSSSGFRPLAAADVPGYLDGHPAVSEIVGTISDVRLLTDGKLNDVYLVRGSRGSVVLKQGLPWVRIYPDWPLPAARTRHEAQVYKIVGPLVGELAPRLIAYDERANALVLAAVEDAAPWSHHLVAGAVDPAVAAALGRFCAQLSFWTSAWGADAARRSALIAGTSGCVLTDMMAHLVFARPFEPDGPHSSGQGTGAEQVLRDTAVIRAIAELERRYRTADDALIHGDLHIASVLIAQAHPVVLDFEFARMGPPGFDLGALWGNIILAMPIAARSGGHSARRAVASLVGTHWSAYAEAFSALVTKNSGSAADADSWLDAVRADAIGYAGCEIIRRLTSGDLVVPLDELGAERNGVVDDLLDVASAAVRGRFEMTATELTAACLAARA